MLVQRSLRAGLITALLASLAACGPGGLLGSRESNTQQRADLAELVDFDTEDEIRSNRSSLFDLFGNQDDPNTTVRVNKYLWQASLEVLNFLPIQSVDPFSGVIVTGYGTPPGGGRAYRATVYVQDPALDARSLKLAMETSGGPVAADTVRAVEDAILTRARQLRIRDSRL
ncbi:DUF3576 domain-containing protein [Frigidibacter albus]|uniref:DUF3576 domain-containing protein n=1 Tax=Frigidibacter albus TaxID=1465486 RepID=A0A6L8VL00_9RHOB|nr:DUF3576 domain-containing protein [Frigidibacter albus]MZQ90431.1 DUF3576 domain-containing protein [Frigidibacter albus]NBE32449.1 DUF3576 domain-containing protein [Frigidibacter albus]GGH59805.1 hypothetical protein GCM10011341_31460 [Frigidibacter albus]